MKRESIDTLSTAVIAFVTVMGAMAGLYYNLWQVGKSLRKILILETVFVLSVIGFVIWIREWSKM